MSVAVRISASDHNNTFLLLMFARPAHVQHPGLADLAARYEPLVDAAGRRRPRAALHHPHLHGPADHRRHRQQEGEQTEGQDD